MIFTIASVILETLLGLAMALIMHSAFKGQGLLRTVVLVPWAVLTVVTAIMWKTIFDPNLGFVNTLLGTNTVWLGEEPQALMVMIFADVWKTAPFMALLLLAGLQVIPAEIYEAAKVDGATAWQRFRRITLPLLMPALLVALIFRTLDALRAFDLPKVLTNGANGTETLSLVAAADVPGEPALRRGIGAVDPDVPDRDDRLVHVHPARRRKPQGDGGGLSMEAASVPAATHGRPGRDEAQEAAEGARRRPGGCGSRSPRSWSSACFRSTG